MNEAKERDLEMFALFHIHPLFFFFFLTLCVTKPSKKLPRDNALKVFPAAA